MIIYFLRHGLALDREQWQKADELRPLTSKGMKNMVRQAEAIRSLDLGLQAIITSPLVRAYQTADIVAKKLDLDDALVQDERLGPGFDLTKLVEILKAHPETERILLVGHEPDFSMTISALIGGGSLVVKKGALARVDIINQEPLQGDLVWLLPPKSMLL